MPTSESLAPAPAASQWGGAAHEHEPSYGFDEASATLVAELQADVVRLQGELAHEKAKAKEIIVQLKREVEVVLQESESAAADAREDGAAALAEAERELEAQRANVEWLSRALERAEERNRGYEARLAAADVEHAPDRLAAAVAKARAPLELRSEGLAAQVRSLTAELEAEKRRYSELQRKSREVPQLEAALLAVQRELAEETSRGIAMEEQLTEALEAEKTRAGQALEAERSAHAKALKAREADAAAAVAAAERAGAAAAASARGDAEALRTALAAEQSRAAQVKERLKAEVVSVMAQREGVLQEHNGALQAALADANAAAAAERQRAASAAAAADDARARCRELERRLAGGGGGGGGAARADSAAEAEAARLASELDAEKAYCRELERQLHAGRGATSPSAAPGTADELAALRAALAAEKTRSRDTIQHLSAEAASARALVAQLRGEIEVQSMVIARTEAVVEAKHALAAENKRLQTELDAEQERARTTELQLIGEIEVLMRDLPGTLRRAGAAGSSAGSVASAPARGGGAAAAPRAPASWA